jgi:hypothetical protein
MENETPPDHGDCAAELEKTAELLTREINSHALPAEVEELLRGARKALTKASRALTTSRS